MVPEVKLAMGEVTLTAKRDQPKSIRPWTVELEETKGEGAAGSPKGLKKAGIPMTDWELGSVAAMAIGYDSDHGFEENTIDEIDGVASAVLRQVDPKLRIIIP